MFDFDNMESPFGLDTPEASPEFVSKIQETQESYDWDSLLDSFLPPTTTTPDASPEIPSNIEFDSYHQQQFEQTSNYTFDSTNNFTQLDQFTSSIAEQYGLLDSTSFPDELAPLSTSCPLDMFDQIDPSKIFETSQTEFETPAIVQPEPLCVPLPVEQVSYYQHVQQNTEQNDMKIEVDSQSPISESVQEPHALSIEPPPPIYPLEIVDAPDSAFPHSETQGAQTSDVPNQTQQAEPAPLFHWTFAPQPTVPSETSQQQNNVITSSFVDPACNNGSQNSTVCFNQLQQLDIPQQQIVVAQPTNVAVDLSFQNMKNAATLRKLINVQRPTAVATTKLTTPQLIKVPHKFHMIPVVSYSRDQLTVIPAPAVKPTDQELLQPAMSCAEYLSSFSFSTPDEEPQPEDNMVVEEHPSQLETTKPTTKRKFVQVQNQYVVNSNGTNQAFQVHEMYKVVNEDEVPDEEDNPLEGTSHHHPRKRQRRINIDYGTDFQCVPCRKTFGKKGSLEQHIRSYHSEPRPWHCDTCGKSFATEDRLQRHVANHDDSNKKFKCSECDNRYVHWKDCERHYQSHHGTPAFPCGQCGKAFVRRDHLLAHEVSHGRRLDREMRKGVRGVKKGAAKRKEEIGN